MTPLEFFKIAASAGSASFLSLIFRFLYVPVDGVNVRLVCKTFKKMITDCSWDDLYYNNRLLLLFPHACSIKIRGSGWTKDLISLMPLMEKPLHLRHVYVTDQLDPTLYQILRLCSQLLSISFSIKDNARVEYDPVLLNAFVETVRGLPKLDSVSFSMNFNPATVSNHWSLRIIKGLGDQLRSISFNMDYGYVITRDPFFQMISENCSHLESLELIPAGIAPEADLTDKAFESISQLKFLHTLIIPETFHCDTINSTSRIYHYLGSLVSLTRLNIAGCFIAKSKLAMDGSDILALQSLTKMKVLDARAEYMNRTRQQQSHDKCGRWSLPLPFPNLFPAIRTMTNLENLSVDRYCFRFDNAGADFLRSLPRLREVSLQFECSVPVVELEATLASLSDLAACSLVDLTIVMPADSLQVNDHHSSCTVAIDSGLCCSEEHERMPATSECMEDHEDDLSPLFRCQELIYAKCNQLKTNFPDFRLTIEHVNMKRYLAQDDGEST